MKAKKKYKTGGKVKKKGMNTAERRDQYIASMSDKQRKDQIKVSLDNYVNAVVRNKNLPVDERYKMSQESTDRLEEIREKNVYKPARNKAEKKFDKNTKYDDLLGRATNPDKKYKKGGKIKAKKKMIRRRDGSYSPLGLWDNIRKNIGSGKKPTKAMLKAAEKIKNES
tara:strand:+ start:2871 stop:3374 length:504 start_codon:yes stop_codon:yes gene_type:complete